MSIKDKVVQILESVHGRTIGDDEMLLIATEDLRDLRCDKCLYWERHLDWDDMTTVTHCECGNPASPASQAESVPPDFYCPIWKEIDV